MIRGLLLFFRVKVEFYRTGKNFKYYLNLLLWSIKSFWLNSCIVYIREKCYFAVGWAHVSNTNSPCNNVCVRATLWKIKTHRTSLTHVLAHGQQILNFIALLGRWIKECRPQTMLASLWSIRSGIANVTDSVSGSCALSSRVYVNLIISIYSIDVFFVFFSLFFFLFFWG